MKRLAAALLVAGVATATAVVAADDEPSSFSRDAYGPVVDILNDWWKIGLRTNAAPDRAVLGALERQSRSSMPTSRPRSWHRSSMPS